MKPFFLFFMALTSVILLNACGACTSKKYTCEPQLDLDAQNWLKIDSGKKCIYKYNGQYDTFTISSYSKSASDYARSGGLSSRMIPCESTLFAKSKESDTLGKTNLNVTLNVQTFYPAKNNIYDATIDIHGSRFRITHFSAEGIEPFDAHKTSMENVTLINGITYPLLNILEKDSLQVKNKQPYKLYFAYQFGLVAFETYPLHEVWVLQ